MNIKAKFLNKTWPESIFWSAIITAFLFVVFWGLGSATIGGVLKEFYWFFIMAFAVLALLIRGAINTAAQIAMLFGIAFTFIGVSVALKDFDPQNIEGSIESLLSGLKTAFYSSVAGMATAIAIKYFTDPEGEKQSEEANWERKLNDTFESIQNLSVQVPQLQHRADEHNALLNALRGTVEFGIRPLVTPRNVDGIDEPVDPLREQNYWLSKVFAELKTANEREAQRSEGWAEFLSRQNQDATEHMTRAMTQVVSRLEEVIREQLGESFRSFQTTVGELDKLMLTYKAQVQVDESHRQAMADTLNQITEITASLAPLLGNYSESMTSMQTVMKESVDNQLQSMEAVRELGTLSSALGDSTAALVEANKEWVALARHTESMHVAMTEFLGSARGAFTAHTGSLKEQSDRFASALEERTSSFVATFEDQSASFSATLNEQAENTENLCQSISESVKTSLDSVATEHKAAVERFQSEMESSLQVYVTDITRRTEPFVKTLETARRSVEDAAQLPQNLLKQSDAIVSNLSTATRDVLTEQIQALRSAIQNESKQSTVALATALVEVTRKVADDYETFMTQIAKYNGFLAEELKTSRERMQADKERNRTLVGAGGTR